MTSQGRRAMTAPEELRAAAGRRRRGRRTRALGGHGQHRGSDMSDNWMPEAKLLASFDHHISVLQERIANDKRHIANLRAQRVEAVESGAELRGQGSS